MNSAILGAITPCAVIAAAPKSDPRGCKVADFVVKSATGNAQSADAGNERETYDAR